MFLFGALNFFYLEPRSLSGALIFSNLELRILLIFSFDIFLSGALNVSYLKP